MLNKEHTKIMTDFFKGLRKSFEEFERVTKQFQESFQKLGEQLPESLKELASHGWYISADSPIFESLELTRELRSGNSNKVDQHMSIFYEGNLQIIIRRLKRDYPERSKILIEAAKTHRQKLYFASTSLFLIIADGLCNGTLYKTKGKKSHLKKQLGNKNISGFLDVITEENAIDIPHAKKQKYPSSLNRHGVLHGLDIDYGTRLNSLKALSLLVFISDFSN
jgi:hypothetical protein